MTDAAAQPRSAIPVERTWDAAERLPDRAAWEAELEAVLADLAGAGGVPGRLGEGAAVLGRGARCPRRPDRAAGPRSSSTHCSATPSRRRTRPPSRASDVPRPRDAQVAAAVAFFEPELLALGRERLREWARSEPALAVYEHYLDDLFRRGGAPALGRGRRGARPRADVFSGPFGVYSALVDSDLVFASAVDGERRLGRGHAGHRSTVLLASPDRALRRSAWESYADGYLGVRNALAANLASAVKQDVVLDAGPSARLAARGVALARRTAREVFDNLIATFRGDTCRRGTGTGALRRDVLGLDSLAAVRRLGAARRRARRARLRAVRRVDLRLARSARRRVRRDGAGGLPGGALGRRLPDQGRWVAPSPPARRARTRSS